MTFSRKQVSRSPRVSRVSAGNTGKKRTPGPGIIGRAIARRTQATLRAEGWLVSPAGGDLVRWTFLAFHPDRGVRLILVRPEAPGPSVLAELLAVLTHATWVKEVWLPAGHPSYLRFLRLPPPLVLTFKGPEHCDACGEAIGREHRLSGLCSTCKHPRIDEEVVKTAPMTKREAVRFCREGVS